MSRVKMYFGIVLAATMICFTILPVLTIAADVESDGIKPHFTWETTALESNWSTFQLPPSKLLAQAETDTTVSTAAAPGGGGGTSEAEEQAKIAEAMANPLSSLWMMFMQNDTTWYDGDLLDELDEDTKVQNTTLVQPVMPFQLTDKWKLIFRPVIPINSFETVGNVDISTGTVPGVTGVNFERETGLGDINYSLFFSPADAAGFIWGLGPSITLPTATSSQLGSEKWSAGPTGVILVQPGWGTYGILVRQLWSFAGDDDRADVNQMLIEPFLNYNLPGGWYLITDPISTVNWNASSSNKWTIPLGGGVGKLFTIGKLPINSRIEAYYNVERPDGAPDWQTVFTFQFLFPK